MPPKLFVATKAFIRYQERILIVRESSQYSDGSNAGRYDIVGGRIEPGERFDASLLREIKEETGLKAEIQRPFYVGEWRPVVRSEQWQIVGIYFVCLSKNDEVKLSSDHDAYQWIEPSAYQQWPLIENIKPAFEQYLATFKM